MRLPAGTIYSKDPSAVHVIPNGIDTKLFKPIEKEIDNQTKKIAVIGTIIKEKNVSFAIDVFDMGKLGILLLLIFSAVIFIALGVYFSRTMGDQ